ncbi:hypothetical protein ACJJH9_00420 [Microbulbifer sp. DLAB2-AF]|uniref:hypothetical protein n=1 Tax=Microbulbifer sp. DLAB2-AF TaxID=3243395 RepID=UPI004039D351
MRATPRLIGSRVAVVNSRTAVVGIVLYDSASNACYWFLVGGLPCWFGPDGAGYGADFCKMILLIADLDRVNGEVQMMDQGPMSKLNQCLRALGEDRSRTLAAHQ